MKNPTRLPAVLLLVLSLAACAPAESTAPAESSHMTKEDFHTLYTALSEELARREAEADSTESALNAEIARLQKELARLEAMLRTDTPTQAIPETNETATEGSGAAAPEPPPAASPTERLTYTVRDGEATVTGCNGRAEGVLVIPATLGGAPVTAIADEAFAGCFLTAISLPATVRRIGYLAFAGSPALETVILPASVGRIDYDAFAHCPALSLICPVGSYAEAYALSFAIPHVAA